MKDFSLHIAGSAPAAAPAIPAAAPLAPSAHSFYDGANRSIRRGQIFHTSTDTRRELDSFSRAELIRRCRWLRGNVGFFKGFVKNSASLVGWLSPSVTTEDTEWNKAANASMKKFLMSKNIFDISGKFNFKTAQRMLFERSLTDGDILTVFTETPSGHSQFAFYEAHQLQNPKNAKSDRWVEGIFTNKHNRHVRYGISDGSKTTTVSAQDACYFGYFESVNHNRAHPPLAHAVNHSIDITEVWGDTKHGIKSAAQFGVVTEVDSGATPGRAAGLTEEYTSATTNTSTSAGVGNTKEVWSGGQMPKGNPGEKFKILNDNRPGPNQREFTRDLKRDSAAGLGLQLEVLEDIANINGPGVRFLMSSSKRWIEDKQLDLAMWCLRVVVYHLAKEIKAGNLDQPTDGEWMNKIKLTPRADLTIDRSQSSQRLDEIEFGAGTFEDWYQTTGSAEGDWRVAFRQKFIEYQEMEDLSEEFNIPVDKVFRPRRGSTAPPSEQDPPAKPAAPSS